jgi:hypothetical protein
MSFFFFFLCLFLADFNGKCFKKVSVDRFSVTVELEKNVHTFEFLDFYKDIEQLYNICKKCSGEERIDVKNGTTKENVNVEKNVDEKVSNDVCSIFEQKSTRAFYNEAGEEELKETFKSKLPEFIQSLCENKKFLSESEITENMMSNFMYMKKNLSVTMENFINFLKQNSVNKSEHTKEKTVIELKPVTLIELLLRFLEIIFREKFDLDFLIDIINPLIVCINILLSKESKHNINWNLFADHDIFNSEYGKDFTESKTNQPQLLENSKKRILDMNENSEKFSLISDSSNSFESSVSFSVSSSSSVISPSLSRSVISNPISTVSSKYNVSNNDDCDLEKKKLLESAIPGSVLSPDDKNTPSTLSSEGHESLVIPYPSKCQLLRALLLLEMILCTGLERVDSVSYEKVRKKISSVSGLLRMEEWLELFQSWWDNEIKNNIYCDECGYSYDNGEYNCCNDVKCKQMVCLRQARDKTTHILIICKSFTEREESLVDKVWKIVKSMVIKKKKLSLSDLDDCARNKADSFFDSLIIENENDVVDFVENSLSYIYSNIPKPYYEKATYIDKYSTYKTCYDHISNKSLICGVLIIRRLVLNLQMRMRMMTSFNGASFVMSLLPNRSLCVTNQLMIAMRNFCYIMNERSIDLLKELISKNKIFIFFKNALDGILKCLESNEWFNNISKGEDNSVIKDNSSIINEQSEVGSSITKNINGNTENYKYTYSHSESPPTKQKSSLIIVSPHIRILENIVDSLKNFINLLNDSIFLGIVKGDLLHLLIRALKVIPFNYKNQKQPIPSLSYYCAEKFYYFEIDNTNLTTSFDDNKYTLAFCYLREMKSITEHLLFLLCKILFYLVGKSKIAVSEMKKNVDLKTQDLSTSESFLLKWEKGNETTDCNKENLLLYTELVKHSSLIIEDVRFFHKLCIDYIYIDYVETLSNHLKFDEFRLEITRSLLYITYCILNDIEICKYSDVVVEEDMKMKYMDEMDNKIVNIVIIDLILLLENNLGKDIKSDICNQRFFKFRNIQFDDYKLSSLCSGTPHFIGYVCMLTSYFYLKMIFEKDGELWNKDKMNGNNEKLKESNNLNEDLKQLRLIMNRLMELKPSSNEFKHISQVLLDFCRNQNNE